MDTKNLKKKRKIDQLIESQKGSLDKFVTSKKNNVTKNLDENFENKQVDNEIEENKIKNIEIENIEIKDNEIEDNEIKNIEVENIEIKDNKIEDNEIENIEKENSEIKDNEIEDNQNLNETSDYGHINIYDPSQWKNIDTKLRDLLVENGPIRYNNLDFPKDEHSRHFSTTHYIRKLTNGETLDRRWLVYSKDLDKIFCFCCKLFNMNYSTSKLANEGTKDWRNIGVKLKNHEITNEHITNMNIWIELETRLQLNKTIDQSIQEQINREK